MKKYGLTIKGSNKILCYEQDTWECNTCGRHSSYQFEPLSDAIWLVDTKEEAEKAKMKSVSEIPTHGNYYSIPALPNGYKNEDLKVIEVNINFKAVK